MQSDSDNDSFQSAQDAPIAPATDEGNDRFTPEEEAVRSIIASHHHFNFG